MFGAQGPNGDGVVVQVRREKGLVAFQMMDEIENDARLWARAA